MSAPGIKVEQAHFLTIGVGDGDKGRRQLRHAAELLQKHGYKVGVTSPEAILAAAAQIQIQKSNTPEIPKGPIEK